MTVFILGAGIMQIPAMNIARELGWRVAAADGNSAAPGACLADRFFHIDLKDREGLVAAAESLASDGGLEAVFTTGTDFSASVAHIAERLGLPGHSFESAFRASDKPRMRAALIAAGVPSPRFTEVTGDEDPQAAIAAAGIFYPLVVKPADSMGARGCRLATSPHELDEALREALPHSRSGRAIVEEYIDGPEFSIDALVDGEDIAIHGIADRHIVFKPYFVELGHTMPSSIPEAIKAEVLRAFRDGVGALGLTRGAAKGDIKWSPSRKGAFIGEIAARLSGGYMSGWTYPFASGIEVTRGALELAAGLPAFPPPPDRGWVAAERAFISIPGKVASIIGIRDAESAPYIKNIFVRLGPGDECRFPSNNVEKCGNVISQAFNRETAVNAAEDAVRGILVRLAPGEERTESFLRGEGRIANSDGSFWPPDAFDLPDAAVAYIDSLPELGFQPGDASFKDRSARHVAALPGKILRDIRKAGADWAGRSFLESAELAMKLAGFSFSAPHETKEGVLEGSPRHLVPVVSGRFWRALRRGGAGAALYVLDTEMARRKGR